MSITFLNVASDTLEKRRTLFLCVFSSLYFVVTCLLAFKKPPWNDELFTLYFSKLSSLNDVWSALRTGADQIPIFFVVLTRVSLALFGVNTISLRLPEVIGYWLMSLSLFVFVARRTTTLTGLLAMLFPLLTAAYDYAYEARPYAIVLGFSALSLVCWQFTDNLRYRKLSLAGLFLSTAAAIASHYYAILILFPLGVGQLFRSLSLRRLDFYVWLALLLSLIPLALSLPLIRAASAYAGTFWAKPDWMSMGTFFQFLFHPALLPFTGALIIMSSLILLRVEVEVNRTPQPPPPIAEIIVAFAFCAIPIVGILLGKFVTGVFADRYALPAVIGLSILVAFLSHHFLSLRPILAIGLILTFLFSFLLKGGAEYIRQTRHTKTWSVICAFIGKESESGMPLVSWHSNTAVELNYYCSPSVASAILYLANPSASRKFLGHDSIDRGLLALKPSFPVRVELYDSFLRSHHQFLIFGYTEYSDWNWLLPKLLEDKMQITLKDRLRHDFLFFQVTTPQR